MTTQIATASADGPSLEAVATLTRDIRAVLGGRSPQLVLAFASTSQPLGEVTRALGRDLPGTLVLGASTAGEFTERGDLKNAVAVFAVAGDFKVYAGIGTRLGADPEGAVAEAIRGIPRAVEGYPHRTGILLLDPLAGNGEEATLILAELLGGEDPLAGGAAGDDLHMKSTHVALGDRAEGDAVVFAQVFSKSRLGLGVCHGHTPLSSPLRVTKAERNVVAEIEGRPAWDVWREETRDNARAHGIDVDHLEPSAEGSYLLRYEAGLANGTQYKIRAPLSRNADGAISFACGIPEGSVILGADFARAVRGMSEELGNVPLAGFETYGEIAMDAGDMSGFHNTTSVVLAFPRD
jgi:methyl-accepting chemotaxis protein